MDQMREPCTCSEARKLLQSFLDGELGDETQAGRVAVHLAGCEPCGEEEWTFRALKSSLYRMRPEPDLESVERLRAFALELQRSGGPGGPMAG